MGIVRSTFLIDPTGNISQIWSNVRVKNHVDTVLKLIIDN
jgi:thioredoxin-dependent peroxiredoxin